MVRSRVPPKILGCYSCPVRILSFPRKSAGDPRFAHMLEHVYERALMSRYLTTVIIATDDRRIYDEARRFGARAQMTRADHVSGTDRVAEVASAFEDAELVVNIQGDEPLIDPTAIDTALLPLLEEPAIPMGTLKKRIEDPREVSDPNVVKVVTDRSKTRSIFRGRRSRIRGTGDGSAHSNTSAFTSTGGIFCCGIRICPPDRSNGRSGWSN